MADQMCPRCGSKMEVRNVEMTVVVNGKEVKKTVPRPSCPSCENARARPGDVHVLIGRR